MANQNDGRGPFESGDRTILKPRPGAGRPAAPQPPAHGAPPPPAYGAPQPQPPPAIPPAYGSPQPPSAAPAGYGSEAPPAAYAGHGSTAQTPPQHAAPPPPPSGAAVPQRIEVSAVGMDPLYQAAGPLLLLAGSLRHTTEGLDVNGLRRQLVTEVRAFEERAKASSVPPDQIGAARYALCATLDEAILTTPWGANSDWASQSLLVTFHRETWGGEKFFQLIDRTREDPARYAGLLEILYACLGLGFAGKFALDPQGPLQRDRLQHDLHERIREVRGAVPPPLSQRWQGVQDTRNSIVRYVPWWVVAAAGIAILTGAYVFFKTQLSNDAEPLLASLSQVGLEQFEAPAAPIVMPPKSLKQLLAPQESQNLLEVEEEGAKSTVILSSSGLFASGSAQVSEPYHAVLQQVAVALDAIPGQVLVVGHSDDQPLRSFRYQNNYELSAARAASVVRELTPLLAEPSRLRSTGMGSSQPRFTPANTEANRAFNRRVEIVHIASGAAAP